MKILKSKKGFIQAELNVDRLTPIQWTGILRSMDNYAEHYHEVQRQKEFVYILSSDGHRDSANLNICATNEVGLKQLLIQDAEELGNVVIEDSIKIDYEKCQIFYKYTYFEDDVEEGVWGFLKLKIV